MSVEVAQRVRCGSCGGSFELTARNVRAARARGEEPTCHDCRHQPKIDPVVVERMKRWWLDRYSLDELLELGRGLGLL